MDKINFLNHINYLKNSNNKNISLLANLLFNVSYLCADDIHFDLESSKRSVYISLRKQEQDLNVDLINDFLDIRFNYTELNFFIQEKENDVLERIFKNILLGNYTLHYSIMESGNLSSVQLIWKDNTLSEFNRKDIYKFTKAENNLKIIEGYDWTK